MQSTLGPRRTMFHALAGTAALAGLMLAGSNLNPDAEPDGEPPPPIRLEELGERAVFTDDVGMLLWMQMEGQQSEALLVRDPSRIVTGEIVIQPGAQFPWHTHHGPVLVTVAEGELTYVEADDCVERVYATGTAFVDPGRGHVHTAFNGTEEVTRLVATFLEVPDEPDAPLAITEGVEPGDCDLPVGGHDH